MTQQTPNPTPPVKTTHSLEDHHSSTLIKAIVIGESGSGKTGALASLALAGYKLHVLDFDNGLDIVAHAIKKENAAALKNVEYVTLRDTITLARGIPKIAPPPTAYKGINKALVEWDAGSFTEKDIIVLDTLTTMSQAAFNEALFTSGHLNARPHESDYGWLADSVLLLIDMLTGEEMKCHLILNSHIKYLAGESEAQTQMRGLPNAKGQQISKDIAKFFNTLIECRIKGQGPAAKRILSTQPQGVIGLKVSNPFTVQKEYPIETGLASLFADILGHSPSEK